VTVASEKTIPAMRRQSGTTRNARLMAIRSFFHHVAANDPASFGVANRILTIPIKRAHVEVTHHLTGAEVDALIEAPDQREARGRRDRAFLLFLARTSARVSQAIGANVADLQLARPRSQVLLRGKGRKERMVPIPPDLVQALTALMKERGLANHEASPLFVGTHDPPSNSLWGDTYCATRRRHRQPAGAHPQVYFTSRLQALARHEASPIGSRSPDYLGLAGSFTGRHHAPLRRRRR
jgi:integrase/recombinase XerD